MTSNKRERDLEAEAISAVVSALKGLDEDAARRVVRWAAERYGVAAKASGASVQGRTRGGAHRPAELAELFAAAGPQTEPEKALVAGYFLQVTKGEQDFDSQPLNAALKHLGHGIKNITRALEALIATKPQLAIHLRKSGATQQARKRYRVTQAGIQRVEAMLANAQSAS